MPKGVSGVMKEFAQKKLHTGSPNGPVVRSRQQAVAIAMSEERQAHTTGRAAHRRAHQHKTGRAASHAAPTHRGK